MDSFEGRVSRGQGRAGVFTRLPWVTQALLDSFGIDPWPGTLNLRLGEEPRLPAGEARQLRPPGRDACAALCWVVRIGTAQGIDATGVLLRPQVPGYDGRVAEIIAAVPLREQLAVVEGDRIRVSLSPATETVRGLLLDVDGTLLDSVGAYGEAAARAAAPLGLSVDPAMVRRSLNENTDFWALLLGGHGESSRVQALRAEAMRHWPEVRDRHVQVFDGVAAALRELRQAGIRLALVTASHGETLPVLERAGLLGLFETIVTAADVGQRKPHPEGLLLALERLQLCAGDVAYVGDTPVDMLAARAAGMRAFGVLQGAGDGRLLTGAGADRLLPGAARLPGLCRLSA
ncbi:MAG: HAD-IA family hydrolase [Chromatiales bacterium]|nr:HAD-IA family hydrolase [Chromatiales bacterium]